MFEFSTCLESQGENELGLKATQGEDQRNTIEADQMHISASSLILCLKSILMT